MKKFFLGSILLVLVLALVPAVSAQEAGCYNLSAEDCAVLQSAAENTNNIASFQQDFLIDFAVSGLELLDPTLTDITFNVSGSGPFTFVDNADLPVAMTLDMVVNASGLLPEALVDVAVPFTIADATIYTLGDGEIIGIPIDPETLPLEDVTGQLGVPVNPDDLLGGEGETPANFGELFGMDDMAPADAGADDALAEFVNYVRLPDQDVMGETMFPFEFTLDVTGLLNSPEFNELLTQAGALAGDDPNVQQILMLLPMFLSGVESDVVITQYVGAEDNFIRKVTFDFDLALDLAMLLGAGGGGEDAPQFDPVVIDLLFDVEISQVNEAFTIEAPADARILSQEELDALFGAAMGAGF